MAKLAKILVLGLLAIMIGAAYASQLDIKGTKPGMSVDEIKGLYPSSSCTAIESTVSDYGCKVDGIKYAGVDAYIYVSFIKRLATSIDLIFDSENFDEVAHALKEKYGLPSETKEEELHNRMGEKFVSNILIWSDNEFTLTASRYSSLVTNSMVTLSSNKLREQIHERIQKDTKGRSDDF